MKHGDGEKISTATLRPLDSSELDQRIHRLIADVAQEIEPPDDPSISSSSAVQPRWIEPAELVRRMQPYLVYN